MVSEFYFDWKLLFWNAFHEIGFLLKMWYFDAFLHIVIGNRFSKGYFLLCGAIKEVCGFFYGWGKKFVSG